MIWDTPHLAHKKRKEKKEKKEKKTYLEEARKTLESGKKIGLRCMGNKE